MPFMLLVRVFTEYFSYCRNHPFPLTFKVPLLFVTGVTFEHTRVMATLAFLQGSFLDVVIAVHVVAVSARKCFVVTNALWIVRIARCSLTVG